MDEKIYWMYGFWIVLSGAKSLQAVRQLIDFHQLRIAAPTHHVLLTAFWAVAFCFYGYVCLRRWKTKDVRHAT